MKILVKRILTKATGGIEESIMAIFESPNSHAAEVRRRANDLVRDLKARDEALHQHLEAKYAKHSHPGVDWDPDKALALEYALVGIAATEVSYSIKEFKTSPVVQAFLSGEDITKIN